MGDFVVDLVDHFMVGFELEEVGFEVETPLQEKERSGKVKNGEHKRTPCHAYD